MTSNRPVRRAASLLAAGAISLALAGTAAAAPGQLAFDECFSSSADAGCDAVAPVRALDGASGVAASADGKSVYVVSGAGEPGTVATGALSHFAVVGSAGRLVFDGCFSDVLPQEVQNCLFDFQRTIDTSPSNGVAVAPDGRRVYATVSGPPSSPELARSSTNVFLRDTVDGSVAVEGCIQSGGLTNLDCVKTPQGGVPPFPDLLAGATGVAVSPDSRNVYVASERADSLLVLSRTGAFQSCFSSQDIPGCTMVPDLRLDGAFGVAVSPDGRSVYVASHDADSISHFRRFLDGSITPSGCVANRDSNLPACGIVEGSLDGANGVAVSPDDASVYVTARGAHAITTFTRASLGAIAFDSCQAFTPTPAGLCQPGAPLIGARGVAVSPDGASVYVAASSQSSGSVVHLVRAPGGQLSFESSDSLAGASSVAVSPDNETVYVVSPSLDSLTQFSRSTTDAGQLAFKGCQANGATPFCGQVPGEALQAAKDTAVSPDGKSVYAISGGTSNAIVHLTRGNPADPLGFAGCLASAPVAGCTIDLPGQPLRDPSDAVVSPDGRDVYVTSADADSIAHFVRNTANGQLTYEGCLANTAADGCADLNGGPLDGARRVAMSADGEDVYVVSDRSGSVAHFARNLTNGQLTLDSCRANDIDGPCLSVPSSPLTGASGVTVGPDGRNVYVTATGADAVVRFIRSTVSGRLTFGDCLADDATQGCTDVPNTPLDGAAEVAMSPDGTSVYVASPGASSITRFNRSGLLGQLAFGACHADNAADGCTDLPGTPLDGLRGLAVSPDGQSVYATGATLRAITHFARDAAGGGLAFGTCQSGEEVAECRPLPPLPLTGAAGVTVSPDGASVYVASSGAGSITRFSRQRPSQL